MDHKLDIRAPSDIEVTAALGKTGRFLNSQLLGSYGQQMLNLVV